MNALLRLLRYAAPYRLRLGWAIAAMLVYAVGVGLAGRADQGDPRQGPAAQEQVVAGGRSPSSRAYLLKGLGGYFSNYLMADVGQRVVRDLRNRLHAHMLSQSASFFARRSTGQLLSRITNDVGQVQHVVSETIGDLLQESLALVGYGVLLFYYDARLALVCITGAPIIVYPLAQARAAPAQDDAPQPGGARAPVARRRRVLRRSPHRQGVRRREARGREVRSRVVAALPHEHDGDARSSSILPPLMELLGGFAIAGALYYGSREIAAGRLTTGEFTAFIAALLLMYGPVKKLSRVNASLQQAIAAAERVFEVLDRHTEVVEKPGARGAGAVPRARSSSTTSSSPTTTGTAGRFCAA